MGSHMGKKLMLSAKLRRFMGLATQNGGEGVRVSWIFRCMLNSSSMAMLELTQAHGRADLTVHGFPLDVPRLRERAHKLPRS